MLTLFYGERNMQGGRGGNAGIDQNIDSLNDEIQATENYLNNLYNYRDSISGTRSGSGQGNRGGSFGGQGNPGGQNFSSRSRGNQSLFRRQYHSNANDAGFDYVEHNQDTSDNMMDFGIRNRDLPTYGVRSGFAPGGRRAFSAVRDGNFGPGGIPMDKEGTIDERTREGRQAADAEGWSQDELYNALDQAPRNKDGSIDLRTDEGRALHAAHFVDDNGTVIVDQQTGSGRGAGMQGGNRNKNRGGQSQGNRS
jgi:hypothetical protein